MKKSLGAKTMPMPTPVWLVGSYDADGKPNLMTAAWGGVCCSKPPCVQVSLRAATYSHAAIIESRAFTVGVTGADQAGKTDLCGIISGRERDKFAACGFTPVKSELVNAPYAEEVPLVLECGLVKTIELGLHTMFVGEIKDIKADEAVLGDEGKPDAGKLNPLIYFPPGRAYYSLGENLGQAFSLGMGLK